MRKTVEIHVCDRCGEPREIELCLGENRDLCAECTDSFLVWFKAKAKHTRASLGKEKNRRLAVGDPMRIARNIIAIHGCVTPRDYAAATGQTERTAGYSLRNLFKRGALGLVKRPGERIRYELPRAEAAE